MKILKQDNYIGYAAAVCSMTKTVYVPLFAWAKLRMHAIMCNTKNT